MQPRPRRNWRNGSVAAGNLSRRDQSVQQAFYAQTLLDVAQAETQLSSDREKLNRLMGLWGADTRWKIPTRLPTSPGSLPSFDAIESAGHIATSRSCGSKERARKPRLRP